MSRTTPISELMSRHVLTLDVNAKLSEARRLLSKQRIHHLPIVDQGVLVGMVSSRDLVRVLRAAHAGGSENVDAILDRNGTVARVMRSDLVTLPEDASVEQAIDRISDGSVHSVLVLDTARRLVGILTDTDLLDYLGA